MESVPLELAFAQQLHGITHTDHAQVAAEIINGVMYAVAQQLLGTTQVAPLSRVKSTSAIMVAT